MQKKRAFGLQTSTGQTIMILYDRPKYRIGVKVDNLTNQKYWSFRLAPQNLARVSVSMNF